MSNTFLWYCFCYAAKGGEYVEIYSTVGSLYFESADGLFKD